jgi:hypothetical protein
MDFIKEMYNDGQVHRLNLCKPMQAKYVECMAVKDALEKQAQEKPSGSWFGSSKAEPMAETKVPSCNPEAHALWYCRASAVGCMAELRFLKICRAEGGGDCEKEQRIMGKCTTDNMKEVQRRQEEIVAGRSKD